MTKTPIIAAALGAAILTSALAGCTSSSDSSQKNTPKPSTSATAPTETKKPGTNYDAKSKQRAADEKKWAAQQQEAAHPTGKCVDGTAIVTAKDTTYDLPSGCATVRVLGSGATVNLGSVGHLVLENKDNTVTAKDVKTIDSISIGNKVTYSADKDAKVTDKGKDNIITRK